MIRILNQSQILINMKVLIVDFEDSFTFNIQGMLKEWGIPSEVLNNKNLSLQHIKDKSYQTVIWGPGPGHPDEYSSASLIIEELFKESKVYQIGICLGHQLILKSMGYEITEAPIKRHGRRDEYIIPSWEEFKMASHGEKLSVQYYSSLAVKYEGNPVSGLEVTNKNGVIDSSKGANHLSFQFHPESVGTNCPEVLFYKWRKSLIQ